MQFQIYARPDRGAERFIDMLATMNDETFAVEALDLDPKGLENFDEHIRGRPIVGCRGIMSARWKSAEAREECRANQIKRRRWPKVLKYAGWLKEGRRARHGPVYLHPEITGREDGLLLPIDGTRRLMSYLEAGLPEVPIVILRLA